MSKCNWCNQEMGIADTCTVNFVTFYDGPKLPVSREHGIEVNGRCHDCGIKHGGVHHPGCDSEKCPKCGWQIISCGCKVKGAR